jgi:hypothetical protein
MIGHRIGPVAIAIALSAGVVAGCGDDGQRHVFPAGPGSVSISGPARVDEIQNLTVPGLHNISDQPVRLRSVRIVGQPPAVRVLNVRAYNINKLGFGGTDVSGDLPSECPGEFVPRSIGSFTIAPHKDSAWMVIVEFKISKPGTYHLRRLKVSYSTDHTNGWQYEYLRITIKVSNPPLPGLRPLPKSAVCGRP